MFYSLICYNVKFIIFIINNRNYLKRSYRILYILLKHYLLTMKTHMNNTTALTMKNDILGHTMFSKHQYTLHSGAVKPIVVTKHKQ
jgi:hypothetical protein